MTLDDIFGEIKKPNKTNRDKAKRIRAERLTKAKNANPPENASTNPAAPLGLAASGQNSHQVY